MSRIAWIASIALVLGTVLAFTWLAFTPAPGSDALLRRLRDAKIAQLEARLRELAREEFTMPQPPSSFSNYYRAKEPLTRPEGTSSRSKTPAEKRDEMLEKRIAEIKDEERAVSAELDGLLHGENCR
jgi:hypothetical protein